MKIIYEKQWTRLHNSNFKTYSVEVWIHFNLEHYRWQRPLACRWKLVIFKSGYSSLLIFHLLKPGNTNLHHEPTVPSMGHQHYLPSQCCQRMFNPFSKFKGRDHILKNLCRCRKKEKKPCNYIRKNELSFPWQWPYWQNDNVAL